MRFFLDFFSGSFQDFIKRFVQQILITFLTGLLRKFFGIFRKNPEIFLGYFLRIFFYPGISTGVFQEFLQDVFQLFLQDSCSNSSKDMCRTIALSFSRSSSLDTFRDFSQEFLSGFNLEVFSE